MAATTIHPTAFVDSTARLGEEVSIGPYAIIGRNVVLGNRCKIGSHANIEYTELGDECQVYPHVCLGFEPQHLKYKGEITFLKVGPRTIFREFVTAHRGTALDRGVTTIGESCYFMALSHIAHDCRIGNKVIMANSAQLAGHVEVGENTFVSSMVGVHQFVRIGPGCLLSGGAMVSLDVAPFCIAQGDRASLRGLNLIGMRRAGLSRASIQLVKEAYRVVFLSSLTLKEALDHPALKQDDGYVTMLRDFLSVSKRGFVRPSLVLEQSLEEKMA